MNFLEVIKIFREQDNSRLLQVARVGNEPANGAHILYFGAKRSTYDVRCGRWSVVQRLDITNNFERRKKEYIGHKANKAITFFPVVYGGEKDIMGARGFIVGSM